MAMKKRSRMYPQNFLLPAVALSFVFSGPGFTQDQKRGPEIRKGPPPASSDRDLMKDLSEDERMKLRKAMSEIWSDPAVVQSRDEVNQAVQAYKNSIQAAILKKDPKLAPVMEKLAKASEGRKSGIPGMTPGGGGEKGRSHKGKGTGGGIEGRGTDMMFRFPPYLSKASESQKKRYFKLLEEIRNSPENKELMGKMGKLREKDSELRRERTKIFSAMQKSVHKRMKEDPELADLLKDQPERPGRPDQKRPPAQ